MAEKEGWQVPEGGPVDTSGSWNLRRCEWGLGGGNYSPIQPPSWGP